jgi:uncharacterized protein YigE (DUF2233 family)
MDTVAIPGSSLKINIYPNRSHVAYGPRIYVIKVDPREYQIDLTVSADHGAPGNTLSLPRLAEAMSRPRRIIPPPLLLMNAGFFDCGQTGGPVRLHAVDGKKIAERVKSWEPLFIMTTDHKPSIRVADENNSTQEAFSKKFPNTHFAVAGMLRLVHEGHPGKLGRDIPPTALTAVGIDAAGNVYFVVAETINHALLAGFLIRLGIQDAVRLDGGSSSGLIYRDSHGSYRSPSDSLHEQTKIPTALTVTPRYDGEGRPPGR